MYVEVPGNQAGEVHVGEGVGWVDRLGRPREGAGVDIRESETGGSGVEAAGRGINVEVKDLCGRRGAYRKNGVKGQKT